MNCSLTHRSGKRTTATRVIESLAAIYPADAPFKAAFAERSIPTQSSRKKRIVRYILCRIEQHIAGGGTTEFSSDAFNIEHILPQNPAGGWEEFQDEFVDALVFRLGNMALLRTAPNRDAGNAAYGAKRAIYAESQFASTRKVAEENAEWTPERIAARQQWMAAQATAIWRISQLS